ncbi:MAG: DUF3050 domain-containing protein [Phycisphaerae bacterium]
MSTTQTVEHSRIDKLQAAIAPSLERVAHHDLFSAIRSLDDVRVFMDHHVYAVWDFMSLLKALQRQLTCTSTPWVPVGSGSTRRLINEIALDEESDELPDGRCLSHLELYFDAMTEAGADIETPREFVSRITEGYTVERALTSVGAPPAAQSFVTDTMRFVLSSQPHITAAAFTIGREEAIPAMFTSLVDQMSSAQPELTTLKLYLERHIELDGDKHGPLGMKMLAELCGDSDSSWESATDAAVSALASRCHLWDGILRVIEHSRQ